MILMETVIINQHMSLRLVSFYLTWHAGWTDTQQIIYQLSGYFLTAHTKGVKALKLNSFILPPIGWKDGKDLNNKC